MKLIITVDTEEDNWARYSRTDNSVDNIEQIVPLQKIFDEFSIKPTYLVTYPVATNPKSVSILRTILEQGKCEIGAHCHPWNTPPFEEEMNDYNSMLCNLPEFIVYQKISVLHDAIRKNFGIISVSFRAGRWGFGPAVARSLFKLGYKVDTSVVPFTDWQEYHGPDFSQFPSRPYRFNPDRIATPVLDGVLLQIPASVGFLQKDYQLCEKWNKALTSKICRALRLKGLLHCLGMLNKAWFSPEHEDASDMIKLAQRMMELNYPCLNMSFHSTSLKSGISPFTSNASNEKLFVNKIRSILRYLSENQILSVTLKEFNLP